MPDVGGCGLPSMWRAEAAVKFLRCGPGFCVFFGSSSQLGVIFCIHLMFPTDENLT